MNPRLPLLLFLLSCGCISEPSDPVDLGELCTPEDDVCSSSALLSRDSVGRNQLDYTVSNVGKNAGAIRVQALIPQGDAITDMGADMEVEEIDRVITERVHRVPAGETEGNRFTSQELGTRRSFELQVRCVGCEAKVDFVLSSIPLECIKDDDCGGGWLCDTNIPGRCVECRSDDECDVDQNCDEERGRCTPTKDDSGCTGPGTLADGLTLLALLFLFVGLTRRTLRRLVQPLLVLLVFLGSLSFAPAAYADPPVASMSIGTGARSLTGELGAASDYGLSFLVSQELRWKYLGGAIRLDTAYFLTNQNAPPFSKDFRTTGVSVGPRAFLPLGNWELIGGVDYVRFGLSANSLVQITGTKTSYNGVMGLIGGRYKWSGVEVRAEGGYQHIFDLPGAVLFLDLSLAISTAL